jgi:protein involved in polysaccharide export with SLBB domain
MRAGADFHKYMRKIARGRAAILALLLLLPGFAGPARAQTGVPGSATHLLAPGDVLAVQLYDGATPSSLTVQVDDAGQIILPLVHAVPVGGLTPRAAGELLTERFRTYYLNPAVGVLLVSYGQIEVFAFGPDFTGRVVRLPSGSRLLDLLSANDLSAENLNLSSISGNGDPVAAGDPTLPPGGQATGEILPAGTVIPPPYLASGAYRRLHLVRGGSAFDALQASPEQLPVSGAQQTAGGALPEGHASTEVLTVQPADARMPLEHALNWRTWIADRQADPASRIWVIDPLQITQEGQLSRYNLALQDKDVLYVPAPERFVDIKGLARPGRYELLAEETLGDVLRLAGSPDYDRDLANVVVQRYDHTGCLSRLILNLYPGLDDLSRVASFKLENRDRIGIYPVEQRVFVLGEVNEAGAFPFVEDSTVLDYLAQAKGETNMAHLAWIAIIRQGRDRLNPGSPPEVIRVNFKELHAGYPSCADFSLLPGDVIYVPPKGKELGATELLQTVGTLVNGFAVARSLQK